MFLVSIDFNLAENGHVGLEIVARSNVADAVLYFKVRTSRFLLK